MIFFKSLGHSIFNLFYPNLCAGCDLELVGNEKLVCLNCLSTLPKTNFHLKKVNEIEQKFWGKSKIEHATAFYYFNAESRIHHIMHALKYGKQTEIGNLLGQKMGIDLLYAEWIKDIDYIIPIPLSKEKFRKRGYNQSEFIAQGISNVTNIPVHLNNLVRIKNTKTQTKLNSLERFENVKDAFEIIDKTIFENKHILLIDDVLTTGATIESCAKSISTIQSCKISIATLAYAIE